MGAVIGIDLGTTNTVVAAMRDGRPVALGDESGAMSIPSIVSFLPSGAVMVGNAAKERRSQDPRNTIYSVKRLIGRTWDSAEVLSAVARLPFELREGPGRATFVVARGETYTLPEISAFVLRKAKSIAELALGEPVDRAVITVPANFNDLQRAATKVAGRVAGLEVLRILNEPTAAALAFGYSRGNRERIAVFDFGGATFDCTLLQLSEDTFEVLATASDTFLGGDDIDLAILEQMAPAVGLSSSDPSSVEPDALERLRAAAEHLKISLSESREAVVQLAVQASLPRDAVEFRMTRDELDALIEPIVARTLKVSNDALTLARLKPRDIDHVLLVGGSTSIPLVKQRVEEFFGRRARAEIDPNEVVALGAAQQAIVLTQVRATASGLPPAAAQRSDTPQQEHQPSPAPDVSKTRSTTADEASRLPRKATDPGVGFGESIEPGRVSVVPPSGPLTSPTPTTRNFGIEDRVTTGVGLGPTAVATPFVGVPPSAVVHEQMAQSAAPNTLDGLGPGRNAVAEAPPPQPERPKQTANRLAFGREPTIRVTRDSADFSELSNPIANAATRANERSDGDKSPRTDPLFVPTENPAISPQLGSPPTLKTTTAAQNLGAQRLGSQPRSARQTLIDEAASWDEPSPQDPAVLGLPIVVAQPRSVTESMATTKVSASLGDTHARPKGGPITDLPLVVARPPHQGSVAATDQAFRPQALATSPRPFDALGKRVGSSPQDPPHEALSEAASPVRLGLPEPELGDAVVGDENDDFAPDEPTATRRPDLSAPDTQELSGASAAQSLDLDQATLPHDMASEAAIQPVVGGPGKGASGAAGGRHPLGRPASLDEQEIRARYGDLPLIVGGKRVGPRVAEASTDATGTTDQRPHLPALAETNLAVSNPAALPALTTARTQAQTVVSAIAAQPKPLASADRSQHEPGSARAVVEDSPRVPVTPPRAKAPSPLSVPIPAIELEPIDAISLNLDEEVRLFSGDATPLGGESDLGSNEPPPKSYRPSTHRDLARQLAGDEQSLPVPDLPPRQPTQELGGPPHQHQHPAAAPKRIAAPEPPPRAAGTLGQAAEIPTPTIAAAPKTANTIYGLGLPAEPQPGPRQGVQPLGATAQPTAPWQPPTKPRASDVPTSPASTPQDVKLPSLLSALPLGTSSHGPSPVDVTPLSLCVETVGGYVDVLVARNTPIPCERTRNFVTAHDNQQTVVVRVAQGESRLFQENAQLGEVVLTGFPSAPRGQARIAVTFGLDSDGLLHVRALELGSGQSALVDLRLAGAPSQPDAANMMARQAAKGHG